MPFADPLKKEWITNPDGFTNEEPIKWAEKFGEFLAYDEGRGQRKLSTSQLRKFFGQLKRLQSEGFSKENRTQFLMLKAQLAYAVGRDKNSSKIRDFERKLSEAISIVVEVPELEKAQVRFKNFVYLTEAIVAYHKAKGGE